MPTAAQVENQTSAQKGLAALRAEENRFIMTKGLGGKVDEKAAARAREAALKELQRLVYSVELDQ